MSPTGDQIPNPGLCCDWESNKQAYGLQDDAQRTEPHYWGQNYTIFDNGLNKMLKLKQTPPKKPTHPANLLIFPPPPPSSGMLELLS